MKAILFPLDTVFNALKGLFFIKNKEYNEIKENFTSIEIPTIKTDRINLYQDSVNVISDYKKALSDYKKLSNG